MAKAKKIVIVMDEAGDSTNEQTIGKIRRSLLNARLVDDAKKFDAEASGKEYKDVIKIAKKYANIEFPPAAESSASETEQVETK